MTSFNLHDVLSRLDYDATAGKFTWRVTRMKGRVAGAVQHNGYRAIKIGPKLLLAHRMVWFVEHGKWPDGSVDHINGNKDDNRIVNLRLATKSQNAANAKRYASSQSGVKGVSFRGGKTPTWMARIAVGGKRLYLGCFSSPELAHAAYLDAAKKYHGDFARSE